MFRSTVTLFDFDSCLLLKSHLRLQIKLLSYFPVWSVYIGELAIIRSLLFAIVYHFVTALELKECIHKVDWLRKTRGIYCVIFAVTIFLSGTKWR